MKAHCSQGGTLVALSLAGCVQKAEVVIDACMLGAHDSAFLQQAAHLTDGVFLRPKHKGALLQYLLVHGLF